MPKMYFKESALEAVFRLGEMLAELAVERGVGQLTVGRGELRALLNRDGGRNKDLVCMALRRFVLADRVHGRGWVMDIVDRRKPIVCLRLVGGVG